MPWDNDKLSKRAKAENYLARSVYKLQEIDRKEKILRSAKIILDLGAAPGSWSQYTLQALPKDGRLVAVDPQRLEISDPRLTFIQNTIENVDWNQVFSQGKADLILSDMAPKTTGVHETDVARSLDLAETALHVATQCLKSGGAFVVKVFMGSGYEEYRKSLATEFETVKVLRPEATKKHSREVYLIGKGFRSPLSKIKALIKVRG